jgi:hypothetical protein
MSSGSGPEGGSSVIIRPPHGAGDGPVAAIR